MNSWSNAIITASVHVSLLAVPAIALVLVCCRRQPRAATSVILWAIALSTGLGLAAFGPPVPWPAFSSDSGSSQLQSDSQDPGPTTIAAEIPRLGWPNWLRQVSNAPTAGIANHQPGDYWDIFVGVVLVGASVSVLRLGVGYRAVARLRRLSRPIHDPSLLDELQRLRRLIHVCKTVELRESMAVAPAATIGWRRPVILLSDDWRSWPPDDLRAVLAHELAHVHHNDHLALMFAAICRALQWYHPAMIWLTRRLRAEQEAAADEVAADQIGNRDGYLVSLARMALRQPNVQPIGVAHAFLSDGGSISRRISMLRSKKTGLQRSKHGIWIMIATLSILAVFITAVRGPAQVGAQGNATTPLDLSLVPKDARMFLAIRPSELLRIPGMKAQLTKYEDNINTGWKELKLTAFVMPWDEIDQMVTYAEFSDRSQLVAPPDNRSVSMTSDSIALLRMTRDYDWPVRLRAMNGPIQVTEPQPNHFHIANVPNMGPWQIDVYVIDARTISFVEPGKRDSTTADIRWGAACRQVASSGIVIGFDNRDKSIVRYLLKHPQVPFIAGFADVAALLQKTTHMAIGVNSAELAGGTLAADCADEAAAKQVGAIIECIGNFGRTMSAAQLSAAEPPVPGEKLWYGLMDQLCEQKPLEYDGRQVRAVAKSKTRFLDLIKSMMPDFDEAPPPAR